MGNCLPFRKIRIKEIKSCKIYSVSNKDNSLTKNESTSVLFFDKPPPIDYSHSLSKPIIFTYEDSDDNIYESDSNDIKLIF